MKVKDHIRITAPIATVFEAITSPEKLSGWWPKSAESEMKEGGKLILTWFNDSTIETSYLSFKENEEVAFEFGKEFVAFKLKENENETHIDVIHSRIVPSKGFDNVIHIAQSWSTLLMNLKIYLEHAQDFRLSKKR